MPVTGYVGADGRSNVPEGFDGLEEIEDQKLSQEMEESLHELWKASGIESDQAKAKFKLEVVFHDDRSEHKPYLGTVVAWTNGGYMNGGGDESIYFCPAETEKGRCFTPIDIRLVQGDMAVCPSCRRATNALKLIGQITARLPTQRWVDLLSKMFHRLGSDADIRVGHFRGDIRVASAIEMETPRHGERLDRVYRDRVWVIYPLKEMMRDVHTGSSIQSRIRALLSA